MVLLAGDLKEAEGQGEGGGGGLHGLGCLGFQVVEVLGNFVRSGRTRGFGGLFKASAWATGAAYALRRAC